MNFFDYFLNIVTACLWGITNVLIKRYTTGIKDINCESRLKQVTAEIKYLLFNWKVLINNCT